MCLSAACGAVCKDCSIVPIQYVVEQWLGGCLVDLCLGDILVKDSVEAEGLVFDSFACRSYY